MSEPSFVFRKLSLIPGPGDQPPTTCHRTPGLHASVLPPAGASPTFSNVHLTSARSSPLGRGLFPLCKLLLSPSEAPHSTPNPVPPGNPHCVLPGREKSVTFGDCQSLQDLQDSEKPLRLADHLRGQGHGVEGPSWGVQVRGGGGRGVRFLTSPSAGGRQT